MKFAYSVYFFIIVALNLHSALVSFRGGVYWLTALALTVAIFSGIWFVVVVVAPKEE